MRAPLPVMTHAERLARQQAKSKILLEFLSCGEVYTSTNISSELLQLSRQRTESTLKSLEKAGFLKSELHNVNARNIRIFGITPHGLAAADAPAGAPFFELGRTQPGWIMHRLEGQRMRLRAENSGWRDWTPERALRAKNLKKVPDAVATMPDGRRIAIEVERYAKTPKRYAELVIAYLLEIKSGKYAEVHFVCPFGIEKLVGNAFRKIESVKFAGETVRLEQKHFARFKFFNFENWPPVEDQHG
ncbi:MAG: hypothetical protein PHE17_20875 [Thiothrix sp.]|uniref:hypothetical protein n=1 Tax=Thiothrix sp. TaxID=1032 RepID=UPI0026234209|nr:hypothetical protein [Thiothrix sp.]MDD5395485.1 hypothetical protein [Thiothrix sp.]